MAAGFFTLEANAHCWLTDHGWECDNECHSRRCRTSESQRQNLENILNELQLQSLDDLKKEGTEESSLPPSCWRTHEGWRCR